MGASSYGIMIMIFIGMCLCWCFARCLISELDSVNIRHREEIFRNQLRDLNNRQFNLEETNYEIDRQLIKSLQKKYKIKINYNTYYNNKEIKEETHRCCICLQQYKIEEKIVEMYCNHLFHPECIDEWLNYNPSCPICRMDIINENPNNDIILDMSPSDRALQIALDI